LKSSSPSALVAGGLGLGGLADAPAPAPLK
jgi:uncharacterized membrane protein YtjA (UPF0391 family)